MENYQQHLLFEEIKGDRNIAQTLLKAHHPLFLDTEIEEQEEALNIISLIDNHKSFDIIFDMITQEKLRYLINIGQIYYQLKHTVYTYRLAPDHLVFNDNGLPKIIYKGIMHQVPPYNEIDELQFLQQYQAIIISVLDRKTDYSTLIEGQLPFYKGQLFCEDILQCTSLELVIQKLKESYQYEQQKESVDFSRISNKVLTTLKIGSTISSGLAIILIGILSYLLLYYVPQQHVVSDIRLASTQQDYSKVVTLSKKINSKNLSQEDKYLVAHSVIMNEPLTDKQKEALSEISTQSNADYLRYWVLIGQNEIDEAIDIASYLDDPQLLIYSMTKKIDEIQRNPNLTADQRTEKINKLKTKLEELKKQYLPIEEVTTTEEVTIMEKSSSIEKHK